MLLAAGYSAPGPLPFETARQQQANPEDAIAQDHISAAKPRAWAIEEDGCHSNHRQTRESAIRLLRSPFPTAPCQPMLRRTDTVPPLDQSPCAQGMQNARVVDLVQVARDQGRD